MLELIQFPRSLGVMNPSPFCMKVEVFLKLAGLPYQVNDRTPPMRLPKGKLPALRDGDRLVCDSHAIVEHLQRQHGAQLPPNMRQPLQGADLALCRLFEEHLYFCALWGRWIDPAGFAVVVPAFFGAMPWPVRPLLAALVRRKMRRALHGQGMGRHRPAEISAKACADLDAAALMLGERPFFDGDAPALLDCTVYAFLGNALFVEIDHPVRRHLQAIAPLVAYVHRMAALVGRWSRRSSLGKTRCWRLCASPHRRRDIGQSLRPGNRVRSGVSPSCRVGVRSMNGRPANHGHSPFFSSKSNRAPGLPDLGRQHVGRDCGRLRRALA